MLGQVGTFDVLCMFDLPDGCVNQAFFMIMPPVLSVVVVVLLFRIRTAMSKTQSQKNLLQAQRSRLKVCSDLVETTVDCTALEGLFAVLRSSQPAQGSLAAGYIWQFDLDCKTLRGPVFSIGDGNRFLAEELRCLKELSLIS